VIYQYVLIKGVTAVLTIASRLAEPPSLNIAFFEAAGPYEVDNRNTNQVPGLDSAYDFQMAAGQWKIPGVDCGC